MRDNQRPAVSRMFSSAHLTFAAVVIALIGLSSPQIGPTRLQASEGQGGGTGRLAYCFQPLSDGIHQMYTIRLDGTENIRIIESGMGINHECWSPDGMVLAATGYVDTQTWSIYRFNVDGTGLERLTSTYGIWDTDPDWSPDGTKIVFTRMFPAQDFRSEIWLMDSDGGNQAWIGIDGFGAKWSPDGSRFVYHDDRLGNNDIYYCDADGSNEERLVIWMLSADEMNPNWSPDGTKLAFSCNRDGNPEIYTVNVDGSDPRRLTDTPVNEYMPTWSPDGTMIAFSSGILFDLFNPVEVCVIDADGSNFRRITTSPTNTTAINPQWQPADSSIVATFLADFLCVRVGDSTRLSWRTSVDVDAEEFLLEKEYAETIYSVPVEKTGWRCFEATDSDQGPSRNRNTTYRLFSLEDDGSRTLIRTESVDTGTPAPEGMMLRSWPNPFNPSTTISFHLDSPADVRIEIFDTRGGLVRVLEDRFFGAGGHSAHWDGQESEGLAVPSGLYFLRVTAGKHSESRKLILLR